MNDERAAIPAEEVEVVAREVEAAARPAPENVQSLVSCESRARSYELDFRVGALSVVDHAAVRKGWRRSLERSPSSCRRWTPFCPFRN